jgi:hypothetical protein
VTVTDVLARVAAALERRFEVTSKPVGYPQTALEWYVVQQCPICEVELGLRFHAPSSGEADVSWLHRELFASYDGHRCRIAVASADADRRQELFERTERESVHMAERAQALAAGDPELAARADRESAMLLVWAEDLRRLV